MSRNPIDPPDTSHEEALARAQRQLELDDLRWILSRPQGRRFMVRLLEFAGVYRTSFNPSSGFMARDEGRRQVGLWAMSEIVEAAPKADLYVQLLRELLKRE